MSSEKCLLTFLFLFLSTHPVSAATWDCDAYYCFKNGNYSSESLYRANLNTLLRSLYENIDSSGFYNDSVDNVNGFALCRGDTKLHVCRSCVEVVSKEILEQCPKRMQAIRWSQYCMLRYSNESIFGILDETPVIRPLRSELNVTRHLGRFKEVRGMLMDELRAQAAKGDGSLWKVAAGSRRVEPDNRSIFGLAQCAPDLSSEDCDSCLAQAAEEIPRCCDNAMGVRVYLPSCIIRYESLLFYNATRLQELTSASPPEGKKNDNTTRNVIIIVISIVTSLTLSFCIAMLVIRKRTKQKPEENPEIPDEIGDTEEPIQYDFEKIRIATNSFSDANKLGQGGFGAVYRGKLINGREIAVKRLSKNSGQGDTEFKNEALLVARLQHRNLVKLLGYSQEGNEKLLIYEFVQNGSLDHFIFDSNKRSSLEWDMRYKIITGIAKGLLYLHEDSRLRIIHRDLKASNVLLDKEMDPKISDFGLARLVVRDATQDSTDRIIGTYGYMAPEYANHGRFSIKSDIFSFGVLVLEIITGMKRIFFHSTENMEHLLNYAWRNWCDGAAANIIDPVFRDNSSTQQHMLRCIHIALLCVQENATNRPTMASVVLMLNSFSLTLPMPSPPAFSTSPRSVETSLSDSLSITTLYPR